MPIRRVQRLPILVDRRHRSDHCVDSCDDVPNSHDVGAACTGPEYPAGIMCRVKPATSERRTPVVRTSVDRRTVLRGGLALGAGALVVGAAGACDSGPTPNEVTATALLPLARAARADAAAARSLAPRTPVYSAALGVVADQRDAHATALGQEVERLDSATAAKLSTAPSPSAAPASAGTSPTSAGATTPDSTTPDSTASNSTASSDGTIDELRSALSASARSAHDAAISLHGYSAGLCGSVSASVATLLEVQLA